jgi:hypothetical protein
VITINLSPFHPVTLVTAKEPRYLFARLTAASEQFVIVDLRREAPDGQLEITHLIIEMFGLLGVVHSGPASIQIDCRNTRAAGKRFLRLQPIDAATLKIRVKHSAK